MKSKQQKQSEAVERINKSIAMWEMFLKTKDPEVAEYKIKTLNRDRSNLLRKLGRTS